MIYKPDNILLHIKRWLPQFIDSFTDEESVTANIISGSPQILRVNKNNHGYPVGKDVLFTGVLIDNGINAVNLDSGILTITTNAEHDLTVGYSLVEMQGFTDSQFNGTFELYSVPSSTSFEIESDTLPVLNGNETLRENWSIGLNEIFNIDSVTLNTFDILLTDKPTFDILPIPQINLISGYRMGIVDDIKRLNEIYTKQPPDKLWLYVIMEDVTTSKDRNLVNDAVRADTAQTDQRVLNIGRFSIVVILPTSANLTARIATNLCYDEIYFAMLKAISGMSFVSEEGTQYIANMSGHGSVQYNRAYYGHGYDFEQLYETDTSDTFRTFGSQSRAWRRVEISFAEIQDRSYMNLED